MNLNRIADKLNNAQNAV